MSKITNDQLTTVWHRMLYSCTHTAKVGVKGLIPIVNSGADDKKSLRENI